MSPEPPTPADVGCVCGKYRPRVYACDVCMVVAETAD